ncbi:MAG TPA: phenazine biosynthesis protein PhzF, partial [Methylomirabilota bacterium]|nr:phenazine biosynthesis protein PhzF [Methylomirabilota bacterium]
VGPHEAPHDAAFEVRAFTGRGTEDPVTGSLNASLAQWLMGAGLAPSSYVAAQGTALQRVGRVHLRKDGDDIWVGGDVVSVVSGELSL